LIIKNTQISSILKVRLVKILQKTFRVEGSAVKNLQKPATCRLLPSPRPILHLNILHLTI